MKQTPSSYHGYRFAAFLVTAFFVVILVNWPYTPSNDYTASQLSKAYSYVRLVGSDSSIYLYPNGQPTTRIYGNEKFAREISESLQKSRLGRYRQAWATEDIAIVPVSDFFNASLEARRIQIRDFSLRDFVRKDILALPQAEYGCYARNLDQFGWASAGYVVVDLAYLRSHGQPYLNCALAGFDTADGFPLFKNTFVLTELPDEDVRRAVIDYVRLCSHNGFSDAQPPVRSRNGISSLPSLGCVARELNAKLNQASKEHP